MLVEHATGHEVAFVGPTSKPWRERVCACVVLAECATVDPAELTVRLIGRILERGLTARLDEGELGQVGTA